MFLINLNDFISNSFERLRGFEPRMLRSTVKCSNLYATQDNIKMI